MRDFVDDLQKKTSTLYDRVLNIDQGSLLCTNQNFVNYKINNVAWEIMTVQSQQTLEKGLVHESSIVAGIQPPWLQKKEICRPQNITDEGMRLRVGNEIMEAGKYIRSKLFSHHHHSTKS